MTQVKPQVAEERHRSEETAVIPGNDAAGFACGEVWSHPKLRHSVQQEGGASHFT